MKRIKKDSELFKYFIEKTEADYIKAKEKISLDDLAVKINISDNTLRSLYSNSKLKAKFYQLAKLERIWAFLRVSPKSLIDSFEEDTCKSESEIVNGLLIIDAKKSQKKQDAHDRKIILSIIQSIQPMLDSYDFDNYCFAKIIYGKYNDFYNYLKESIDLKLESHPDIMRFERSLIEIASDMMRFDDAQKIYRSLEKKYLKRSISKNSIKFKEQIYLPHVYAFNDLKSTSEQFEMSKQIFNDNPTNIVYAQNRLAFANISENNFTSGLDILVKLEEMTNRLVYKSPIDSLYQKAYIYFYKGLLYYKMQDYSNAICYLRLAQNNYIDIFGKYQHYVSIISYYIWKSYANQGKMQEALSDKELAKYLIKFDDIKFWVFQAKKGNGDRKGYYEDGCFTSTIFNELQNL